jgi:hypothetical protein
MIRKIEIYERKIYGMDGFYGEAIEMKNDGWNTFDLKNFTKGWNDEISKLLGVADLVSTKIRKENERFEEVKIQIIQRIHEKNFVKELKYTE